jgi:hypothetical protein
MTRKDEIRIACKMWETMAQFQSILWERYHKDLLDLIQDQQDVKALQDWTKLDDAPF